ncbi:MAG: FKBP-type peptidyl-prolyl cis-trans isomerase [Phycisphaerales bacterium]|nr:FKBP-type peptidyl-prolyl cis-trans isomerase [Phycisphaerales bacterium]
MLSTAAAIVTASLLTQPQDYTTIPPNPYEIEQVLASTRVDATKAIELATTAVGGSCAGIDADVVGETVTYKITMGTASGLQTVTVDAQSGAVTAPTITIAEAIKAATQAVDGMVKSVQLNTSTFPPTYNILLYANGQQHEMVIDATNAFVNTTVSRDRFPGQALDGAEFVTEPSGLMYADIVKGPGATPSGPNAKVTVHYTGYLVDGTEFDSSYARNQPATFPLGGVIKGWTEGVGSMSVGGKRKLVIPYELAYGAQGRAPVIPPKATLIFDVELIEIQE